MTADSYWKDSMRGRMIRPGDGPASNGNVANIITVVRILMAPAFIWLLLLDDAAMGPLRYLAAAIFIVGIATDSVDGFLARRRNLVTDMGKILDPIADKILTGGALVSLSVLGELPWWVTIVILIRELGITAYRFAVIRDRVVAASAGGKLKTVVQAVAISFALVPLWVPLGDWVHVLNAILMTAALILTLYSGATYLRQARRAAQG